MSRVPPAKGLSFLTWAQIEQIDARLARLAAYAEQRGCGVQWLLQLNENGMLNLQGYEMVVEKIKATR